MIHVTFKTEIDKVHERNLELEERIRELEADNVSLKGGWLRAQDRIAKAKAILEDSLGQTLAMGHLVSEEYVRHALDALEGK